MIPVQKAILKYSKNRVANQIFYTKDHVILTRDEPTGFISRQKKMTRNRKMMKIQINTTNIM